MTPKCLFSRDVISGSNAITRLRSCRYPEDILFIGINTIEKVVTEKNDPLPVIRCVKFLAEKSTKKMFEPVAFVKYDEAVRIGPTIRAYPSSVSSKQIKCILILAWKKHSESNGEGPYDPERGAWRLKC